MAAAGGTVGAARTTRVPWPRPDPRATKPGRPAERETRHSTATAGGRAEDSNLQLHPQPLVLSVAHRDLLPQVLCRGVPVRVARPLLRRRGPQRCKPRLRVLRAVRARRELLAQPRAVLSQRVHLLRQHAVLALEQRRAVVFHEVAARPSGCLRLVELLDLLCEELVRLLGVGRQALVLGLELLEAPAQCLHLLRERVVLVVPLLNAPIVRLEQRGERGALPDPRLQLSGVLVSLRRRQVASVLVKATENRFARGRSGPWGRTASERGACEPRYSSSWFCSRTI